MLVRKATYFTPDVVMKEDMLHISGKMWMENPPEYFEEIIALTRKSKSKKFSVVFDVEHINSSSIKQLLTYFRVLSEMLENGNFSAVEVTWSIAEDDEELRSLIKDIGHICDLDIKIINK